MAKGTFNNNKTKPLNRSLHAAAFGFSEDAYQECVRYQKQSGRIVKLLTVQEILDEEHVQKM